MRPDGITVASNKLLGSGFNDVASKRICEGPMSLTLWTLILGSPTLVMLRWTSFAWKSDVSGVVLSPTCTNLGSQDRITATATTSTANSYNSQGSARALQVFSQNKKNGKWLAHIVFCVYMYCLDRWNQVDESAESLEMQVCVFWAQNKNTHFFADSIPPYATRGAM